MNRLVLVNVAIRCILGMYSDYLVSLLIKLVRLALSFIGIIVNGSKKIYGRNATAKSTKPAAALPVLAAQAAILLAIQAPVSPPITQMASTK